MSVSPCWRCLARPSVDQLALALSRSSISQTQHATAAFSTSAVLAALPPKKKANSKAPSMRRGEKTGFQVKKKKRQQQKQTSSGPTASEKRYMRKRILLSNTSALEVQLEEMSKENISDVKKIGTVLALPNQLIDKLRASEAFRRTQSWQYFRKPATLVRKETVELAKEMKEIGNKHISRVLTGDRGSGKSLLLLQAQAIAFQEGWTVITIPDATRIVNGNSTYRPVPGVRPLIYEQPYFTRTFLHRLGAANPQLAEMKLALQHDFTFAFNRESSLKELASLGERDADNSVAIFDALMKELIAPGRPPVLIALDGLTYIMRETLYKSPQFQPVHAHDLTFVRWFNAHLSGKKALPNGGLVLAALSASNDPKIETLGFRLHQLEVKQALEKGLPNPRVDAELPDAMLPFLLATGQQPNPVPQPVAHFRYDERIFDVLGSPHGVVAGNQTADAKEVQVHNIKGMSKDEARGIMEYWAKSGVMRQTIDERTIGEKWSLSGGGVPGELERTCMKFRI